MSSVVQQAQSIRLTFCYLRPHSFNYGNTSCSEKRRKVEYEYAHAFAGNHARVLPALIVVVSPLDMRRAFAARIKISPPPRGPTVVQGWPDMLRCCGRGMATCEHVLTPYSRAMQFRAPDQRKFQALLLL